MKRLPALLCALICLTAPAFGQSIPLQVSTPVASTPTPGKSAETVTGRIAKLDTNAGTFSVKAAGSKKTVQLKAGGDIDVARLRRGQRVIVTYSDGVALKLEATRSTQ